MLDELLRYKPVRYFPELYNVSDFTEYHPVIDPETNGEAYKTYWESVTKKVLEGKWGHDYDPERQLGGWRYQPPIGYTYINCWVIDMEDPEQTKARNLQRPKNVDIVWIHSYGLHAAKGFSGWEDDPDVTCLRAVQKLHNKEELDALDSLIIKKAGDSIYNKEGNLKQYVDAVKYLYRTHPVPYGRSLYFNPNKNLFNIQSRRGGKTSYAACAVYHEFFTYGKKYYDEHYMIKPRGVNSSVIASIKDKSEKFCKMILDGANYLNTELGSYNGSPGWFHRSHYGTLNPNDTYYHGLEITKIVNKKKVRTKVSSGSTISHLLATVSNPDVGAAGAQAYDVVEEFGLVKNAKAVIKAIEPAQTGTYKIGTTHGIGTGGNTEKIQETKEIMENPDIYDGLGYEDLAEGRVKDTGLFLPSYLTRFEFKDAQGNTLYDEAFKYELDIIRKIINEGDRTALELHLQAYPLVLSHIFMGSKINHWPLTLINPALRRLDVGQIHKIRGIPGTLTMTNYAERTVRFDPDMTGMLKPIYDYKTDSYPSVEGCVVIYEEPEPGLLYEKFYPAVYFNVYKVVYDSIKDPKTGASLACIYVFKGIGNDLSLATNTIVASYIGRYENPNDMDQIAINLAVMYGARILYEQNINTILQYADLMGFTDLLQPTPYDSIKLALKAPKKKYQTGLHMSGELKLKADLWGIPWLSTPIGYTEEGDRRYRVDTIPCRRFLEELTYYDDEKNFDCISTFRLFIVWLQQELQPSEKIKEQIKEYTKKQTPQYDTVPYSRDYGSIWRT